MMYVSAFFFLVALFLIVSWSKPEPRSQTLDAWRERRKERREGAGLVVGLTLWVIMIGSILASH